MRRNVDWQLFAALLGKADIASLLEEEYSTDKKLTSIAKAVNKEAKQAA